MANLSGSIRASAPLTISDWKAAQISGDGLERLCSLVEDERQLNPTTHAWISLASRQQIEEQWNRLQLLGSEAETLPLYGVPFAAKDNIDCAGFVTTAACPSFNHDLALSDAPIVAKLKAAGAILVGKTNLDQFATGLVGTRSPYGAVPNSFDPARVSGGSSSGSAVVVARGIVPFSFGTDTAGSGRVPAGFNNVVGLKPTRGALSTRGVVPACRTLDCVSIFTLTVADAETILSVAEGFDVEDSYSRCRQDAKSSPAPCGFGTGRSTTTAPSLAICSEPNWFGRGDHFPAYERALEKARSLGWNLIPVDFKMLFELAELLYSGPWVAERYEAIRDFIERVPEDAMDPIVRSILIRARSLSAADAFAGEYLRQDLTRRIEVAFNDFDGILVPTSPTFPTMEQVSQRPVEENSILGTYTNFVNFLDWSALSIPAGFRPDGLPFGITLISNHWQEPQLLRWAHQWFGSETRLLGATGIKGRETPMGGSMAAVGYVSVAVVGAHLAGFPLNKDLVSRGAELKYATTTSKHYRLFALKTTSGPKKPALQRVSSADDGEEIQVEVWDLPEHTLASFMSTIPSPLGIGSLELKDKTWVLGFVCEPLGLVGADDITEFRGWKAYTRHLQDMANPSTPDSPTSRPISKVLVANRGEIALRIIQTIHKMGLQAVAIYSDIDVNAPHVSNADIALRLEGSSVSDTYLNIPQILDLAKSASVDAVIPGYGFLAENAEFATAVEAAGIRWIGPTPKQMSDLGLKHLARAIAAEASVPPVPGSRGLLTSIEDALKEGQRIGFPLMLKSTAGGGGIGLSYCKDAQSLRSTFESVQRQASANFGNGGVFLELFIQNSRHIEVQVIGDGTGRVLAAGERDCSLQRRHQKVIEESPAIMVPDTVREKMKAAAVRLASSVKYRNVGTVEFIYDVDTQEFYFLEVNTRLQVEHPITELVTGLDLVECMINIANGNDGLFESLAGHLEVEGVSIEVRLYAESPLQNFRPCSGCITDLEFPSNLRVDTWVKTGTEITTFFDPLVAKIIAFGSTREEALEKLAKGLAITRIEGIETNLDYLRQIVSSSLFRSGNYNTKSLDSFQFVSQCFEVVQPGALTMVQDYPGRTGYWSVGVPPGGPMDHLSFRLSNSLVNNEPDAAGLECTFQGPSLRFHCDAVIAVTGGDVPITIDNVQVAANQAIRIRSGQTLVIGMVEYGYRVYLAVQGGIRVPVVMGSRTTFELGKLGGFKGRKLQVGDILPIASRGASENRGDVLRIAPPIPIPRQPNSQWSIRVIPGPHGAPEYFTSESFKQLFSGQWKVHHNSNRLGVRLTGPQPEWARQTGGEAGLHPSNIHDSPYSIGSVSFTGDEAVVLSCDGPSLGGFVVFCVIVSADLWKMGQVRPGDTIRFDIISVKRALELNQQLDEAVKNLTEIPAADDAESSNLTIERLLAENPGVVGRVDVDGQQILVLQAGDRAMLLEFGEATAFDLRQSFGIFAFCQQHKKNPIPGVEELTPGVFTLHVFYKSGLSPETMMSRFIEHVGSYSMPTEVASRVFHLPLAFNDSVNQAAVQRYSATIRSEAPWLPSNIEFLETLNGIDDISGLLQNATFLVLGLGDVFMGSPCAIPLDPRHRLFGTKYNPSRSFTPRGAVGIGGQYICIYATDSPGGYQLVGRTVDVWDSSLVRVEYGEMDNHKNKSPTDINPWLFRQFDRITFYNVSEAELDTKPRAELVRVSDGVLDLLEYETWLDRNKDDISASAARQARAIESAPFLEDLRRPYLPSVRELDVVHSPAFGDSDLNGERVAAMMPGRCYKVNVKRGDIVEKGDILLCLESSKMEVEIRSPASGKCKAVLVEAGDLVEVNDGMVIIEA
ncbi:hypothetical protein BGZ63DRAFT_426971 [Mariannaea sp. PMI_226]|nr:hypothetical protein BGZ63DRAFT_426971 [Mariannaea sp. PMI_226]